MIELEAGGGNTQANSNKKSGISPPAISMPKGGGAIRGVGEKFAANPVTGTASLVVPIYTSPGRSGFTPQLSLSYDSGAGNSPFGFGWNLSLPSITRKTDKGVPRYEDTTESDVFILSGMEDLVPFLEETNGGWMRREDLRVINNRTYRIQRYRPRIEGLFAQIERWTNEAEPADTFWRSISNDNVTTWYGKSEASRIADPADLRRVFSWLICESYDDKGNVIIYEYKPEDSDGVEPSHAHERNRTEITRSANRYLKRIKYGNQLPYHPTLAGGQSPPGPASEYLFEVVFDYGDHATDDPAPDQSGQWTARLDSFSSYRAGFEVRTYRLCQRVLMFHHFSELGAAPCLVRSTDFTYSDESDPRNSRNPIFSFLISTTQSGYKRLPDGSYLRKALPPLEFQYTEPIINQEVREVESLENLPYGLDGMRYRLLDLDGEGLSGILTEQGEGWFYKRNLSPATGSESPNARLGPVERVGVRPSLSAIGSGRSQFFDLAGDGSLDLAELKSLTPGFYERTCDEDWNSFVPFESLPNIDWSNPNLKVVDLTGDGLADILISEDEAFRWYPSLFEAGFGPPEEICKALDEEKGPNLVFADGTQSVYLADMSGDRLTDIVRIRNGEVCYWPNLGYGHFGAKVTMDNSPWFDTPDQFDQTRIRLADITGSGLSDIIYLTGDGIQIYFNQSGNSWSDAQRLEVFPPIDQLSNVQVADLLGNGTACLVWSSPLPGDVQRPMRYVDLMGGQKPNLLVKSINNLGAETIIHYAASTRFYLADKLAGRPWITSIPFPVHVVERVETYDHISRNRFVTSYAYHHGYFDGIEREFRGFGLVEQWDTEEVGALGAGQQVPAGVNFEHSSHVPPVLTRTWFHTGVYLDRNRVSNFYAGLLDERDSGEYYREPGSSDEQARQLLLDDTVLPAELTIEEEREACRALKGAMLRKEVYALDGSEKEDHPYTVSEQNLTIRRMQPSAGNRHAVFFTHARETISYHYERNPLDPRISHALTLETDDFGNVLKSAAIGYGRRQPDSTLPLEDQASQAKVLITYTESDFTNRVELDDAYRMPLPSESRTYELTGLPLPVGGTRLSFNEVVNAATAAASIPYEQTPDPGLLQKRLLEHVRILYRPNDLGIVQGDPLALLPLGVIESRALPGESYKLAFTPGLIAKVYGTKVSDPTLEIEGRYVHSEGDAGWWIPSGRIFFSPRPTDNAAAELAYALDHFFQPHRFRTPFHTSQIETESFATYDAYNLMLEETCDALGNRMVVVENNYRVLQPTLIMDPNRNRTAIAIDTLGMVVGTAVMGKPEENLGDSLEGFEADLDDGVVAAHLASPFADPHAILQRATQRLVYDLFAYHRTKTLAEPESPVVYTLSRETHEADLAPGQLSKVQHSLAYSDGFGREIQKKIQAEPGPLADGGPEIDLRWVSSGWTVLNNKGKPVRQFEPFFTDTHAFEFDLRRGVSSILFYDPLQRVIATLHPNHTWKKVVFDAWRQESWDVNDTVLIADPGLDPVAGDFFRRLPDDEYLPTWYAQREGGALGPQEETAARKAAAHANTPAIAHFDSLGRTFLAIAHNRFDRSENGTPTEEFYRTRAVFDIEGNQREVIDAKDRVVMSYEYDMVGNSIYSSSMDNGERWMLNDVSGNPIYGWDSRNHRLRTSYDALRRPIESHLQEGDAPELLVERTVYGETQADPETGNLRGRVHQSFDGAGIVTNHTFDFKGNPIRSSRQLAVEYKEALDWSAEVALEADLYTTSTAFDALNRPVAMTMPDNTVIRPTFNEANLVESIQASLRGSTTPTVFVSGIDYNARGQRRSITYGNGASTTYEYDEFTFRLAQLKHMSGGSLLQDLSYTYDPIGNITSLRDDAQQTIYFNNAVVEPHAEYTYDAYYQLISATGREHLGQLATPEPTWNDAFRVNLPHPHDGQAMRRYTERYEYDAVGNILQMVHQMASGNWRRGYTYDEPSLTEPAKKGNRLSTTIAGGITESYTYDLHGNMTTLSHLPLMGWNYLDQLVATSRQVTNNSNPMTTHYVYDSSGQRVRKIEVTAGEGTTRSKERVYLGGFEIYREYNPDGNRINLERETLHIVDGKQRVALVETRTVGNDGLPAQLFRYQFGNHLGSSSLELDGTGHIISYEEYYPYGSTSYQAVDASIRATAKRYRYSGMERDEGTGLSYHGARYYAPWLGRWTSTDPAGLQAGINLYRYSNNNSIRLIDPNGNEPFDPLNYVTGGPLMPSEDVKTRDLQIEKLVEEQHDFIMNEIMPGLFLERAADEVQKLNSEGKEIYQRGVTIETAELGYPYKEWKCMHYQHACAFNSGVDHPTQKDLPFLNPGSLLRPTDLIKYAWDLEKAGIIDVLYFDSRETQRTSAEINSSIYNLQKKGGIQMMVYSESAADSHGHTMVLIKPVETDRQKTIERDLQGKSYVVEEFQYTRFEVLEAGTNIGLGQRDIDVFDESKPQKNRDVLVFKLTRLDKERLIELYQTDAQYREQFNKYYWNAFAPKEPPLQVFPSLVIQGDHMRYTHR